MQRAIGLTTVIAIHGFGVAALLAYEPARSALLVAAPIMVNWVPPPAPEQPEPKIEPPRPRPVAKREAPRPVEPPPVLTAAAGALSPVIAPAPPPVVAPPPPPAPAVAPIPVAITPPLFDADYLDNPPPVFPAASRRMGEQGRVILRVLVSPDGGAADVQVRTSSGHERLDQAARDAVRRWKFLPARRGEQAVAAWVLIPISFRLEG